MKIFLIILLLGASSLGFTQPDSIVSNYKSLLADPNTNYYEIKQAFDAYIQSLPADSINSYIKEFKRFESFWDGRAGSFGSANRGNLKDLNQLYKLYNNSVVCEDDQFYIDNNFSKWNLIGPTTEPGGINQGLNNLGHVSAVLFISENEYFLGTNASGIWRTVDGGQNWRCVTDEEKLFGIGITTILKDPTDLTGKTIYASTGYNTYGPTFGIGLIKSIDGGETWTVPSNFDNSDIISTILKMDISENGILYAITEENVYSSSDGGNSWINISPTNSNTINYLVNSNDVLVDVDIVPDGTGTKIFITSSDYNAIGGGAQILYSGNAGLNWNNLTNELKGWEYLNYILNDPDLESSNIPSFNGSWTNVTSDWFTTNIGGSNVGSVLPSNTGSELRKTMPAEARNQSRFFFDAFIPANTKLEFNLKI